MTLGPEYTLRPYKAPVKDYWEDHIPWIQHRVRLGCAGPSGHMHPQEKGHLKREPLNETLDRNLGRDPKP